MCTGITIKPRKERPDHLRPDDGIRHGHRVEHHRRAEGQEVRRDRTGGKPGLRWTTKYGFVGANAFDLPVTVDGLNEKGLHVGLFYFPGFAKYQEIKAEDVGKALAPWELGVYLLGTCRDVKEAVAAAKDVRLARSSRRTWASCRVCITS